jgi:hypothetical protein
MIYGINEDAVRWRIVDGEAVLIHVKTTFYYSLNGTGTAVWQILAKGERPVDEIVEAVAARFDSDESAVRGDVQSFLDQMLKEELVLVH